MPRPRKRSLTPKTAPPAPVPVEAPRPVAVIDMGASAIRLMVAEAPPGQPVRILVEASLKALDGFRRIMDGYGVVRYRAVATSAVREAQNSDQFLDRVRLRTGIDVEVIDGSE